MKSKRFQPSHQPRANRHSDTSGPIPLVTEDDLYDLIMTKDKPLLLILDEVTDPHNLGACLRSANAAGALAIVTPKHHSASVTETVVRVACGAAATTPVVQVTNLARAMKKLQELGLWLVGTDDTATKSIHEMDLRGAIGLVMGAEGSGMRRLTREGCDFLARIPMLGTVPCLNVSVASGVCLFEAVRQRHPA
jgi:23S rRNA (guanosine2251-2'-O)-methyltransferase